MTWRASIVLLALVMACGGSSDGIGGAAGSGGTGGVGATGGQGGTGGSAGDGGQGGTGGIAAACVDSLCSCNEAGIRVAIAEGGGPFTFDCDGPTTVVTKAEIVIDNDVVLDGEGNLVVDGNDAHRLFLVLENVTAELRGFTVTKGFGGYGWWGGGITNLGVLTLTHSTVSDSASPGDGSSWDGSSGGGIYNYGLATLTMTHSTVSGNTAARGGGIYNSGLLTMSHSAVSGNRARRLAGGIYNVGGAVIDVGINAFGGLTMTHSTVSGNTAALGTGGIWNLGLLRVVASTLSGNTADDGGPASISNHGTITLTNSVVNDDCELDTGAWAFVTSTGYTIESPGDTCGFDQPTDQVNVSADDLKLGPLQDNGGPTMTHALLPGSVAIDVIPTDMCEADTDQRGEPRPGGAMCDVGAFEVQLFVSAEKAEAVCQAWCDSQTGCDDSGRDPEGCRHHCRMSLAWRCGEHRMAQWQCQLDLECNDPLDDCDVHHGEWEACAREAIDQCDKGCGLETTVGTRCATDIISKECLDATTACFNAGGDCDPDVATGACSFRDRAGQLECPLDECIERLNSDPENNYCPL